MAGSPSLAPAPLAGTPDPSSLPEVPAAEEGGSSFSEVLREDPLEIAGLHVVQVRSLAELKVAILQKFDGAEWVPEGATEAEVQLLVKNGLDAWVRPTDLSSLRSEETIRIHVVRRAPTLPVSASFVSRRQ